MITKRKSDSKYLYDFDDGTESVAKMHVRISSGNGKIGKIWNVSTIPGSAAHRPAVKRGRGSVELTNVAGTCGGVCGDCHLFCYAFDSARQHHNSTIPAWAENTLVYRKDLDRFMKEVDDAITAKNSNPRCKKVEEFRINVSGELETYASLVAWAKLAEKHPEVRFGIYTKRFTWVMRYVAENRAFPKNFFLNASEWNGNIDAYKPALEGKVNIFAYCDSLEEAEAYLSKGYRMCKAIDYRGRHTGVKCDECGYCYGKEGIVKTFVLDHSSAGRMRLAKEAASLASRGKLDSVLKRIGEAQAPKGGK